MNYDIRSLLVDLETEHLSSVMLTAPELSAAAKSLPYNSTRVFAYAQEYCGGGNDCPDVFQLDCTHFLSHCLFATGVILEKPSVVCNRGLSIRVNELASAFNNSVGKYANVKRLGNHRETRRGDFCFIPSWFGLSKEHGMLLASTANAEGAMVYAHTNNRCGTRVNFEGASCVYYRIEDV